MGAGAEEDLENIPMRRGAALQLEPSQTESWDDSWRT